MSIRKIYHYTPRYAQVAQNEAADLLFNMQSLAKFIANHPRINTELLALFNEKIERMKALYDIEEEIIKFSNSQNK